MSVSFPALSFMQLSGWCDVLVLCVSHPTVMGVGSRAKEAHTAVMSHCDTKQYQEGDEGKPQQ